MQRRSPTMFSLVALMPWAGAFASAEVCDVAIVGGGPGGVYAAYRLLVDSAGASGEDGNRSACIYERSGRLGGRILSLRAQGPKNDLVVDLGAYRFVDDPVILQPQSEYIYTPLTAALVETKLRLPTRPYEPGVTKSSGVKKIVDSEGENAGYATFVDAMIRELDALPATRFRRALHEELVAIEPGAPSSAAAGGTAAGGATLHFASGLKVEAASVVLNLPQLPLLRVLGRSEALLKEAGGFPDALQAPRPIDGVKLYLHYSNAWWANFLGLTSGEFSTDGGSMANDTNAGQLPALFGRYHDGHTRCDGDETATRCRGFLEATYTYAYSARWFLPYEPTADPPYTTLNYSEPRGKYPLDLIHRALLSYHRDALEKASTAQFNATAAVAAMRPEFGLLSYWGAQTPGYGGAVHSTRDGPLINVSAVAPTAIAPFGSGKRVFVANEAFGALRAQDGVLGGHHGWAECSLVQAENVLTRYFGIKPPSWVNASIYEEYVRFHDGASERARRGGWRQG